MRVLLLGWDGTEGCPAQAAGLAGALAAAGHDVRLVTRLRPDGTPPAVDGVEVHAVTDAPPIVPQQMTDELLAALAFAGRATSVAVRRLEERPVDVVHAEGWWTGPTVSALGTSHDVPVVAVLEPGEHDTAGPRAEVAAALADRADLVVRRSPVDRATHHLPVGTDLPSRRPGPPPSRGPVRLVVDVASEHRSVAAVLRGSLSTPRRVSGTWTRRPLVAVVLAPAAVEEVVGAWARGVPVVTVPGPTGDLVEAAGGGVVVDDEPGVGPAVDALVEDPARVEALGAAGWLAVQVHRWDVVATVWEGAAASVVDSSAPHLHAAG